MSFDYVLRLVDDSWHLVIFTRQSVGSLLLLWDVAERKLVLRQGDQCLREEGSIHILFPNNVPDPPSQISRSVMPLGSTVLLLFWKHCICSDELALRAQPSLRYLMVQCDGSGGDAWGLGVFIPSLDKQAAIGGGRFGMEHFIVHGIFDSALVETLALAFGLFVVFQKLQCSSDLRESIDSVLVLIDNTNVVAGKFARKQIDLRIEAALKFVLRYASKVLVLQKRILVVHKGVYGIGKTWVPDRLAANCKEQGKAWKMCADPPECSVSFGNPRYGRLRESGPELLLEFDIGEDVGA